MPLVYRLTQVHIDVYWSKICLDTGEGKFGAAQFSKRREFILKIRILKPGFLLGFSTNYRNIQLYNKREICITAINAE